VVSQGVMYFSSYLLRIVGVKTLSLGPFSMGATSLEWLNRMIPTTTQGSQLASLPEEEETWSQFTLFKKNCEWRREVWGG